MDEKNPWTLGSIIPYHQSPTNLGLEHWLNTAHLAYSRDWKEIKSTGQAVKKQKLNMLILSPTICRQEIRGWSQKDIISLSSGKVLKLRVCNVEIYRNEINNKSRLLVFRSSIPMQ